MDTKRNKSGFHPRNLHRGDYDLPVLTRAYPELRHYVTESDHGGHTVDFANPAAVKALNTALLQQYYGIIGWDIPAGFLCPPIPGRVDYLHYVAELLGVADPVSGTTAPIKMVDIGTGANGIYALLAASLYGWSCTASDIDTAALDNVAAIIANNPTLSGRITLRLQCDNSHVFKGIIKEGEHYDLTVCNPPFHASLEEALKGSQKKVTNLNKNRSSQSRKEHTEDPLLNFGGQKAELWCKGGEIRFLRKMLKESKHFSTQCKWFTTLISKGENVAPARKILSKLCVQEVREIKMQTGNKVSRVLAWRY